MTKAGRRLSKVRSRDTEPEMALRRALWAGGLRGYRANVRGLPGTPDILYRKRGLVVFVDGCFWHGCLVHRKAPKTNRGFWERKLAVNKARDAAVDRALRLLGYAVLHIWEHDVTRDIQDCVGQVRTLHDKGVPAHG